MRILVVDDNARVRRTLFTMLDHLACEIIEAVDGYQAIALFKSFHPDIVLMDVRMPGMSGIETTACLYAMNPEVQVIIVTEYDDLALRHDAERAGATRYYLKENLIELRSYLETQVAILTTLRDHNRN